MSSRRLICLYGKSLYQEAFDLYLKNYIQDGHVQAPVFQTAVNSAFLSATVLYFNNTTEWHM